MFQLTLFSKISNDLFRVNIFENILAAIFVGQIVCQEFLYILMNVFCLHEYSIFKNQLLKL